MRYKSMVLAAVFVCTLPVVVMADITGISPASIPYGTVEETLTIFGANLSGTESTLIAFDGPAGQFVVTPSNSIPNDDPDAPPQYPSDVLVAGIPATLAFEPGAYAVTVIAKNVGEAERTYGPATFTVGAAPTNVPPLLSYPEVVFAEATGRDGARVSFEVSAQNATGESVPVTCSHASGSQFPLGATLVVCSASNEFGTSSGEIYVYVADLTPPVVVVPDDIDSTASVVTFEASAIDDVDGALPVTCTPPSGSTFPDGVTQVVCTATDGNGNVGYGFFDVRRAGGEPVLTVPGDLFADSPDGNPVEVPYTVSATNDATIVCLPSGFTFAPGVTTVTCTATNRTGSDTESFRITVRDLSAPPPELTVPADITAEATSSAGAVVSYSATATNGAVVVCSPPSGSTFALGQTTVQCSATNGAGSDEGSFHVTVVDTRPPVLTLPADITAEATGPNGAVVVFAAFATDAVDGLIVATCTPPSGSTFGIRTTVVTCTARDAAGHTVSGAFNVIVRDTTPPVLHLPANITAEAHFPGEARVNYTATATDAVSGNVAIQCTPPSGSRFRMGTTPVNCRATDTRGNVANGSFSVTVRDSTAPVVIVSEVLPGVLWPANGAMWNATAIVVALDNIDLLPTSRIVSVTSNQPVTGPGDTTSPDWQITGPSSVRLRAERTNNADRIYTITIETTDESGNVTTTQEKVYVARSRRRAV